MIHLPRHPKNSRYVTLFLSLAFSLSLGISPALAVDTRPIQHLFDLTRTTQSSLALPSDVAVAPDGRIYVVDGGNHRVVIYSVEGDYVSTLGSKGSADGQFIAPIGITVDKTGHVYVADTVNHRVQIFDKNGKFIRQIPVRDGNKKIRPVDVAVSQDAKTIYVTGNNNHKVMLYTPQGKVLGSWGKKGNSAREFRYPATITIGKDGAVYVVDVLNSRVQIFETDGKLRTTAGSWGVLPGQLFRPKGVALDKHDKIYISDSYLDVIEVFDNKTRFSSVLGVSSKASKFVAPGGIAIDKNNRIYVTEMLANKVSVYVLE